MAIKIICKCGCDDLVEVPSGAETRAWECKTCGGGILVQYLTPEEEWEKDYTKCKNEEVIR